MSGSVAADAVRRHFEVEAERFDAIYSEDKVLPRKVVDRLFHQVVRQRFELAVGLCGDVRGKRVLDVGCGSGRYAVELARRGAQVVGIDFASAMLEVAAKAAAAAAAAGVAGTCRFESGDFLEWCEPHHFEICLGIGFFDYTAEPGRFLERMRSLTLEKGIFSFPIRWTARSVTRWLRLRMRGCPVFFYDDAQIRRTLVAKWEPVVIQRLSRDYIVDARVGLGTETMRKLVTS